MKGIYCSILILLGLPLFEGCKYISGDTVTINGSFTNLSEKQLYIYQLLPNGSSLIDSASYDASGNFSISIQVKKTGYYLLRLNANNEITLVISPGEKITVTGNGKSLQDSYRVEGSTDSKLYFEYNKFTAENLKKVDSLSRIFAESRANPDFILLKQQLDSAYIDIFIDQKEKVISFINTYPNSLASLLVISNNFGPNTLITEQSHPDLFLKLDSSLTLAYPDNDLVNAFHTSMLDFKAELADIKAHDSVLKPGMPAPEIILPNSNGKEIRLSSLKGKLTLIYFWSSWNAQSRQTNMNLANIYNRYRSQGFEIFAVSIDSDADLWKKSYLLDKAYWIQVNDVKGLESAYCKTYGVRVLPKMILVAKDGSVIAGLPELSQLETLIKKNL